MSIIQSMGASAGARLLTLPITAVAAAFTTYLIIGYAGALDYGFINLIGSLFLLLPFADLGVGAAVINSVAEDGSPKRDTARGLTRAALGALVASSLAILLVTGILALTGRLANLLGVPDGALTSINLGAFIAVAPFALSLPFGIGQRVLLGLGKNHLVNLYAAITPVTAVVLTCILIAAQAEPVFLAAATPGGVLVSSAFSFAVAVRMAGWQRTLLRKPVGRASKTLLWGAALPMLVITIATPVGMQSGRLILAHRSTPDALAEFALSYQFYLPAFSIASAAGVALWPVFARNRSNARGSWLAGLRFMGLISIVLSALYVALMNPIGQLVSHGEISVGLPLAAGLGILLIVMSLHQVSGTFLTTPRQLAFQAVCAVVMCIISVGLGVALAPAWGASGVVAGSILGVLLGQAVPCLIAAERQSRVRGDALDG